ncbi:MAG: S26 family signal peptidase [Allosphingosinicella sp.]|uniref:S26 family signal peptidase n=1 Tax=Allosphingosinicella sp. TaxID=2823234 RepID=UPI00395DBE74
MPDERGRPVMKWGEELRRNRDTRRTGRARLWLVALGALAVGAALATLVWRPRPLLVWNASASSPTGLYLVTAAAGIEAGDSAVAWAPGPARRLAAERRYLPSNLPLVKRVEGTSGDRVCAVGEAVYVNGELRALRRELDGSGRPLPWWTGCVDLAAGDILLLAADRQDSFDGRYFGVVRRAGVVGRARLIWAS